MVIFLICLSIYLSILREANSSILSFQLQHRAYIKKLHITYHTPFQTETIESSPICIIISEEVCNLYLIHDYFFYNFFTSVLGLYYVTFQCRHQGIFEYIKLKNIKKNPKKLHTYDSWDFFSLQLRLSKTAQNFISVL